MAHLSTAEISLAFTSFDTESGYDYVTINRCQDSSCSSPERVGRLSGSSVSASSTYTSSTGYLQVVFESDGSVQEAGFVATWSTAAPAPPPPPAPPTPPGASSEGFFDASVVRYPSSYTNSPLDTTRTLTPVPGYSAGTATFSVIDISATI